MTDQRLSERQKKKALDRWENEGGKFFDDRTGDRSSRLRKGTNSSLPDRATSDDRK